jgi:hypothetical protein
MAMTTSNSISVNAARHRFSEKKHFVLKNKEPIQAAPSPIKGSYNPHPATQEKSND